MRKNATFNISIKLMNIHLAKPTLAQPSIIITLYLFVCHFEKKREKQNNTANNNEWTKKWESNVNKCSAIIQRACMATLKQSQFNADYHNGVDEKCKIRDPKRALNQHHAILAFCCSCMLLCLVSGAARCLSVSFCEREHVSLSNAILQIDAITILSMCHKTHKFIWSFSFCSHYYPEVCRVPIFRHSYQMSPIRTESKYLLSSLAGAGTGHCQYWCCWSSIWKTHAARPM